jgi:hypothetical protein
VEAKKITFFDGPVTGLTRRSLLHMIECIRGGSNNGFRNWERTSKIGFKSEREQISSIALLLELLAVCHFYGVDILFEKFRCILILEVGSSIIPQYFMPPHYNAEEARLLVEKQAKRDLTMITTQEISALRLARYCKIRNCIYERKFIYNE